MEILIRSSFESVETAETCVKRIRDAKLSVKEITLIPPKYLRNSDEHSFEYVPLMNNSSPGTVGFGNGIFPVGFVNSNEHREAKPSDFTSGDAVIEVVTDTFEEHKIRSIIVNSGGRDTAVF